MNSKIISSSIIVFGVVGALLLFTPVYNSDAPRTWGLYYLNLSSLQVEVLQVEALVELHDMVIYYLLAILITVV
jgi:hypothetical protein